MQATLKKGAVWVALAFGTTGVQAASRVDIDTIAPKYSAALAKSSATTAEKLGLGNSDLKALYSQTLPNGKVLTRYQQLYRGIPVLNSNVVEHRDNSKAAPSLTGAIIQGLASDVPTATPQLSSSAILNLAKSKVPKAKFEEEQVQLYVHLDEKSKSARLVYLVSFFAPNGNQPSRPFFLMDANTGEVVKQWDGLARVNATGPGGNSKTGQYEFGVNYGPLDVSSNCAMDNGTIKTVDQNNGTANVSTAFQFNCPRNTYRAVNGAFAPMNDAHFFGNATVKMYRDWFGVGPIQQQLVMRVHYGQNYEGAGWTGGTTIFGDGLNQFYPLVSADVIAHEVSHGFTEQNSKLLYFAHSGGMNEAFSDMAGEALEYYLKGTNDFKSGAAITKTTDALRYMYNPPLDGNSKDNAANVSPFDNVHYSSGVYNKAFYLLATSPGWNTRKAFEVMFDANRLYWTELSTFNEGACGVEQAASNRGYNVSQVSTAFNAVGVNCDNYKWLAEQLYLAYTGRPGDPGGLKYWTDNMAAAGVPKTLVEFAAAYSSNPSVKSIVDGIALSTEAQAFLPSDPAGSHYQLIGAVFQNEFGRGIDSSNNGIWNHRINSGESTRQSAPMKIMADALASPYAERKNDALTVGKKVGVSLRFTEHVNEPAEISSYITPVGLSKGRNLLKTVTSATQVQAFIPTIDATIADIVANH
ncbi:M4 family metallopeptidase [Pseudoduganella violacea]|uniref:Neutral metalloproteinase n=1 Tax=Pseudoduganella violacea TaxID=1715466 RepID=A0A7W5B6M3_9BURK|nr:M4 family metallopeptidase [Pseudoduganella violacea]MBB3117504.1 Zn-dependent metalloprotease [Pseudoduganella violacea]